MACNTLNGDLQVKEEPQCFYSVVTNTKLNSLHAMGTFMCQHNASVLCDGHIYVPADIVQSIELNSEAKRAFGVNPCLFSSNKCRRFHLHHPTGKAGRGGASS